MQDAAPSNSSPTIPEHLHAFHRPNLPTSPGAKYQYSDQSRSPSPTSPGKTTFTLSPPFPPTSKRAWRELLEDILLKDWLGTQRSHSLTPKIITPPPCHHPHHHHHNSPLPQRPPAMRMKDSDDYITARAANPRTGLVSPSVPCTSPRPPCTPDDPGEALQLLMPTDPHHHHHQPPSPTPDTRNRPPLRRANEGRKVSNERPSKWRAESEGWITETGLLAASPRVACIKADAVPTVTVATCAPTLGEDQFVVRMPSAQEPQPYEYPGYSARQIEAFEHYRRKARLAQRESSGGYGDEYACLRVVKRRDDGSNGVKDEVILGAASFAPFSSPKTPMATKVPDAATTTLKTLPHSSARHFHRKPVGTAVDGPDFAEALYHHSENVHSAPSYPRQQLPSTNVGLSTVSAPRPDRKAETQRICSLGCHKNSDGSVCLESRRAVSNSTHLLFGSGHPASSAEESADNDTIPGAPTKPPPNPGFPTPHHHHHHTRPLSHLLDTLLTAILAVLTACTHLPLPPLPHVTVLDILSSSQSSTQDKVRALKTLLASAGQVVMGLVVVAMLWQVGSAVVRVLEVVCWPLMLPVRILRWVGDGG